MINLIIWPPLVANFPCPLGMGGIWNDKDGAKIQAIIITITNCDRYSNKLKIATL